MHLPYDLRVFQFPKADIPYGTLAVVFILCRPFKCSKIAVSDELHCVRGHISHNLMRKKGKSNQSLSTLFFLLFVSYVSVCCIFSACVCLVL